MQQHQDEMSKLVRTQDEFVTALKEQHEEKVSWHEVL